MSVMSQYVATHGKNWLTAGMSVPYVLGGFITSSPTVTITPGTAPQEGDLLVVQLSNSVVLDPANVTPPAGWTSIISGNSTPGQALFYKVATASEPSSYVFTMPSTSNFGWEYMNLRGVITTHVVASPKQDTNGVPGSVSYSCYVPLPGIVITFLTKSTTTAWSPSAGWALRSGSGQAKAATRIETQPSGTNISLTWSLDGGGTTSTNVTHFALTFLCKSIKH